MNQLIKFVSEVPRFNFAFNGVDIAQGFTRDYFQSIIVWSCIPVLFCLILLAIILIVWSSKCCAPKSSTKRQNSFRGLPQFVTFLIFLSCLCLSCNLVSNEFANRGARHLGWSSMLLSIQTNEAVSKVHKINESLYENLSKSVEDLKQNLANLRPLQLKYLGADALDLRIAEVELAISNASTNLEPVVNVAKEYANLVKLAVLVDRYEYERWILFSSLWTIILIVMLSSITIVCTRSKKGTILFGAISIFVFILSWCIIGASLAYSLVLSDLCSQPFAFMSPNLKSTLSQKQLLFYGNCTVGSENNPLHEKLHFVEQSLDQVPSIVDGISFLLRHNGENSPTINQIFTLCGNVQHNIYDLFKDLGSLEHIVGCRSAKVEREALDESLCFWSMFGSLGILLSSTVFALLLFVVLMLLNRLWRRFDDYVETRGSTELFEHDPFLVNSAEQSSIPADFYGSHVSNPRTRYGNSESNATTNPSAPSRGDASPVWRSTPPPAYEQVPLLRTQVRQQRM